MFLARFLKLSKSPWLHQITKRSIHPPLCPHTESGEKHQYSKPDCSKVVIVGGTGAIGLATANQLLCAKTAQIALIDTDPCKGKDAVTALNCAFGKGKAVFVKADVTNRGEIQDALRRVRKELQKIDAIVNTFGVWDEKNWEEEVKVNLVGTLNVNDIAKDLLTKPGFVLNVIGTAGITVFNPSPVLAATFMGVVGYTQGKGHEKTAAVTGVRTVALCTGVTQSDFTKDAEKKTCCPQTANDLMKYLNEACWQKPDVVGRAVVEVFKYAPTGSIWVVEGSRLFLLKLPDLNTFRTLENQFI